MRKIKEVLRLKHEAKLSNRATARSCNICYKTVKQYLKRAKKGPYKISQKRKIPFPPLMTPTIWLWLNCSGVEFFTADKCLVRSVQKITAGALTKVKF